jgi:hypothetical protein
LRVAPRGGEHDQVGLEGVQARGGVEHLLVHLSVLGLVQLGVDAVAEGREAEQGRKQPRRVRAQHRDAGLTDALPGRAGDTLPQLVGALHVVVAARVAQGLAQVGHGTRRIAPVEPHPPPPEVPRRPRTDGVLDHRVPGREGLGTLTPLRPGPRAHPLGHGATQGREGAQTLTGHLGVGVTREGAAEGLGGVEVEAPGGVEGVHRGDGPAEGLVGGTSREQGLPHGGGERRGGEGRRQGGAVHPAVGLPRG